MPAEKAEFSSRLLSSSAQSRTPCLCSTSSSMGSSWSSVRVLPNLGEATVDASGFDSTWLRLLPILVI
jgi:hypothetical protein